VFDVSKTSMHLLFLVIIKEFLKSSVLALFNTWRASKLQARTDKAKVGNYNKFDQVQSVNSNHKVKR